MNNDFEIRLLIVDDEKEACDNLQTILSEYIDIKVNIVGIANDTKQAEELINTLNPDAIFLDIEMPDENAFQFLERIHPANFEIIFVTAYDEFAIKAFKLNALDYILKPVDIDELADAVSKLRDKLYYKQLIKNNARQFKALKEIANKEQPQKIILKALNHIEVVDFNDIYSLEGMGNYCRISFNKAGTEKQITTSHTVSFYEELLPPQFYRIHKSYVINCRQIEEIISDGNYYVVLNNKDEIAVSRRRYGAFIDFLKENNFYSA